MRINNIIYKSLFVPLMALICSLSFIGCSDDNSELLGGNSGFIQFKVYKSMSQELSKASEESLNYLNDAKKIELTLLYKGASIVQTLNLNTFNDVNAEFGLRSDKLELLAGEYSISGVRLFNSLDEAFGNITYSIENKDFVVVKGGLQMNSISVDVQERGMVKFTLVKDLSNFTKSESNMNNSYLFSSVRKAELTVKNMFTQKETIFKDIKMRYQTTVEGNGSSYQSAVAVSDSILYLEAGNYKVTRYMVFNSSGNVLEGNDNVADNKFAVADNKLTNADVPVTLLESADNIKDYIALKAIWEALDGENWYYYGESSPMGVNWDFNKDIDMWGDQPGIGLDANGRVASLNIGAFGARGDIPAELGQLTELKVLSLGTHNDMIGGGAFPISRSADLSVENKEESRLSYFNLFHKKDRRASFSEPLLQSFKERNIEIGSSQTLYSQIRKSSRDVGDGDLNNAITSIPEEIGNLTKLQILYIANGHIEKLPESLGSLESLTDLEIYNCPKMTKFPSSINKLPKLQLLNFSRNRQMSAEEIFRGFDEFAKNAASNKELQILYAGFNNFTEVPESFKNLERIGLLEMTNCNISKIHPLGKGVSPVQILFDNNNIEEIPVDADGYFCGTDDIELFSFADNKIKALPNIFNAITVFTIEDIDFSFNDIESIQGEEDGSYKGMNVQTLNLAGNKLKSFPNILFNAGSAINNLNLSGNGIEEFKGGNTVFFGKYLHLLESLDLTFNKLSSLPNNLNATTVPYLYGIDLSNNRFSEFPYQPLNVSRLTVMGIRHQRDEDGVRCLTQWPKGLYTCPSLRAFYISGNDIGLIEDTISYMIYIFDVKDNPNLVLDVTDVCYYISAGAYNLIYDSTQDIRGCDALILDK